MPIVRATAQNETLGTARFGLAPQHSRTSAEKSSSQGPTVDLPEQLHPFVEDIGVIL
jgi:hypothetical protein